MDLEIWKTQRYMSAQRLAAPIFEATCTGNGIDSKGSFGSHPGLFDALEKMGSGEHWNSEPT
jgi:hypothetical protein